MKKIWNHLTSKEILGFYEQIESMCEDTEHDSDVVINAMYELDLENFDDPADYVNGWLRYNLEERK